jgi:hypothetical protein
MKPMDFCQYHGFELHPELQTNGRYIINITDKGKRLFKTGIRLGTQYIHQNTLEDWISKCYDELMDLILDKLYN